MRRDVRGVQARRELAMTRPELRSNGDFYYEANEKKPDEGRSCNARASDEHGSYALPFAVYWRAGAWWNAACDRQLEIQIVKWRYA